MCKFGSIDSTPHPSHAPLGSSLPPRPGAKLYRRPRFSSGDAMPLTPLNGPVSAEPFRPRPLSSSPYYPQARGELRG